MTSTYAAQARFGNYDPSSFGWPRQADLVPFVYNGVNFGQAARAAVPVFTAVLDELVPLIPGGIVAVRKIHDDWAYSPTDDLPDGSWSFHHYGIAFDLDWQVNPMGTYTSNPREGEQGAVPHAAASRIATRYGCEYGGDWSGGPGVSGFKDYMHFEIHLSPDVARTVKPITAPTPTPAKPATPTGDTVDAATAARIEAKLDALLGMFNGAGDDGAPHSVEYIVAHVVHGHRYRSGKGVDWPVVTHQPSPKPVQP